MNAGTSFLKILTYSCCFDSCQSFPFCVKIACGAFERHVPSPSLRFPDTAVILCARTSWCLCSWGFCVTSQDGYYLFIYIFLCSTPSRVMSARRIYSKLLLLQYSCPYKQNKVKLQSEIVISWRNPVKSKGIDTDVSRIPAGLSCFVQKHIDWHLLLGKSAQQQASVSRDCSLLLRSSSSCVVCVMHVYTTAQVFSFLY